MSIKYWELSKQAFAISPFVDTLETGEVELKFYTRNLKVKITRNEIDIDGDKREIKNHQDTRKVLAFLESVHFSRFEYHKLLKEWKIPYSKCE